MAANLRLEVYALHGGVYVCDAVAGKRIRLGNASLCIGAARVDRAAVAGDLVSYGTERCGVDTGSASVSVLRPSDDKQLRNLAAITGSVGPESYQSVGSIVVKPDASVAWIATIRSIIHPGARLEVHANGALLDFGSNIKPGSLRLRGSTLTWRHGRALRSATLR
jgi:hypothetical protein